MKALRISAHSREEAEQWLREHFQSGVFVLQQAHDDFCPSVRSQRDADCKPPCKPDFYLISLNNDEGRQN